jgi:hypothetical protein
MLGSRAGDHRQGAPPQQAVEKKSQPFPVVLAS